MYKKIMRDVDGADCQPVIEWIVGNQRNKTSLEDSEELEGTFMSLGYEESRGLEKSRM